MVMPQKDLNRDMIRRIRLIGVEKKIILLFVLLLFLPRSAKAVPPPEIINNFGLLFLQIFSVVSIFFSGFFYFLKNRFPRIVKPTKYKIIAFAALIIACSSLVFFLNRNAILARQDKFFKEAKVKEESDPKAIPISPEQLSSMLDRKEDFRLFDVRLEEEYATGHLKDAEFWRIEWRTRDGIKAKASTIDSGQKAIFYCYEGGRSKGVATRFADFHPNTYYVRRLGACLGTLLDRRLFYVYGFQDY